jgi:hypothetical protein
MPPFWNQTEKQYHNGNLRLEFWDEVVEKCNLTGKYWTHKNNELQCGANLRMGCSSWTLRDESHYTSRSRSVAERHLSVKISSCLIKRRCSHWQERLRHVSVPFRRCCWARMFDVTEPIRTCLYPLDSDNVNSLTSPPIHFECLQGVLSFFFCLQKWINILTELVRKCEELYQIGIVTVSGKKNCGDR